MKLIELKGSAKKTFINSGSLEGVELIEAKDMFYVTITGRFLSITEMYDSFDEAENRLEQIIRIFGDVSRLEKP